MSTDATVECLVCRKHRGEVAVPGGFIYEDDQIAISHAHMHVIGRRPGAPRQYWGPKVDDWPEAPRGGEAEIALVADRLRIYLREHFGRGTSSIG